MGHNTSKHRGRHKASSSGSSSSKTPGLSATKSESSTAVRKHDLSNLAVITVIFNPVKYKSRYEHYHKFEAHMSDSGVHLTTVECIFESAPNFGLPRQDFEITRANDRHHIQLIAPSILWMKENLTNIAIQRLPRNIEYVAWIDADIEFERLDWPHLTITELQRYPIVQLFELSFFLGPGGKKDILRRDYSFGYSIRHNKPIDPRNYKDWYAHPGYAWAMRRSAFNTMGGLVDFCIIGSGDLHFAFALLHRIEETLRPGLHQDYQKLALAWGDKVAQLAQNGANVGYVPVNLYHHWHGERSDRNYVDRWSILEKHQYSPLNDLEKNDDSGLLRLADKKSFGRPELVAHIQALERDIVDYFKSRNEDNNITTNQKQPPPPVKTKPFVSPRTQPHRSGGFKPTTISSRPHIWTSGPAGTHVDHQDPQWDQCMCPGHHHHPDNHDCPCSPHHHHHHDDQQHQHHDDHHPNDQHHHHQDNQHHHHQDNQQHHHQDNQHHHHHDNDDFGGHHSSHGHEHHGDWSNVDNSGHNYDHSSGGGFDHHSGGGFDHHSGGGFDNTNYGGPGSFY